MNTFPDNIATWLELAVAPTSLLNNAKVRLHPISECSDDSWFALTVNGKLLFATGGSLTLLKGASAVERFLFLIGLRTSELGSPLSLEPSLEQGAFRMQIERNPSLGNFGELKLTDCAEVSMT